MTFKSKTILLHTALEPRLFWILAQTNPMVFNKQQKTPTQKAHATVVELGKALRVGVVTPTALTFTKNYQRKL